MKWTIPVFIAILCASAVLFTFFIDTQFVTYFGNSVQLGSIILAAINLNMVRLLYSPGDIPRKAWGWLALGMVLWIFAQSLSSYRELVFQEVPYGDVSDIFWILGYIPFSIGLITLIRSFLNTGLPAGSKQSYFLIGLINVAAFLAVLFSIILPEFKNVDKTTTEKILDISYPALDILVLALSAILLRISWILRGGRLANAWLTLCVGFAMSAVADLMLVGISDLGTTYRYLDILYFSSYFCIAVAGSIQVKTFHTA